jgi:branched-chain amino acid transport system ATP-binding protein
MVEQNVKKALPIADRGYVLERGRARGQRRGAGAGCAPDVVREAYLGAVA